MGDLGHFTSLSSFMAMSQLPDDCPPDSYWLKDVFQEEDLHTEEGRRLTGGRDNYNWLALAARFLNPARVVEFGVRYGYSLACFIQGSARGRLEIWSFDCNEQNVEIARRVLDRYRPRAEFYYSLADTRQLLPPLRLEEIDLCYLDACHEEFGVQREMDLVWPTLRPGGLLLVDDVETNDGAHRGLRAWCRGKKLAYKVFPSTEGLGAIVKP